jgi:hypothetical protein
MDPIQPGQPLTSINKKSRSIAQKMLRRQFPITSICRVTHLSLEAIKQIQVTMSQDGFRKDMFGETSRKATELRGEIHLLATKTIVEHQAHEQAPWLMEDDWYLGYRAHQKRLKGVD